MKYDMAESLLNRLKHLAYVVIIFIMGFSVGGYVVFKQNIRPEQLLSGRWYGEYSDGETLLRWQTIRLLNGTLEKHLFTRDSDGNSSYQRYRGFWRIEGGLYRAWSNTPYELLANRKLVSIESKRFISQDIEGNRTVFEFKTENTSIIGRWLDQFHHRPENILPYTDTIKGNLRSFATAAQDYLKRSKADTVTFSELKNDPESGYDPPQAVAGETYEHLVYPSATGRLAVLTRGGDLIELEK